MNNKESFIKYTKQMNITKLALYPAIIIGTIIISGIPFGFNLEKILTASFFGTMLLKCLLQIMWSHYGLTDGEDKEKQNPQHLMRVELNRKSATLIKDKGLLNAFKEYNQKDYLKQRQDYIEEVLFSHQIDKSWYEMELSQVIEIYNNERKGVYRHDNNGNELARLDFNRKQLKVLKMLKKGNFKFDRVSAETILSGYQVKATYHQINENVNTWAYKKLGTRLLLTILGMVLTTGLEFGGSTDIWESVLLAITNLALSITVYFVAFKVGIQVIEKTDAILELKDAYIHCFVEKYESGKFVPSLALYTETVVDTKEE